MPHISDDETEHSPRKSSPRSSESKVDKTTYEDSISRKQHQNQDVNDHEHFKNLRKSFLPIEAARESAEEKPKLEIRTEELHFNNDSFEEEQVNDPSIRKKGPSIVLDDKKGLERSADHTNHPTHQQIPVSKPDKPYISNTTDNRRTSPVHDDHGKTI